MLLLLSTVHHHHWPQSLSTVISKIPTIATTITITSIANFESSICRDRRTEGMVVLDSKDAEWDKTLNSYVLNYHGRASQVGRHCIAQKSAHIFRCATGWSKETVDYKFLLTDPKISKSVITQWFLESLYREVLVFWCFKSVRCVEFCLSEIFQYGHLLHHTRP